MKILLSLIILSVVSCSTGERMPASLVTRYEMDLYDLLSSLDRYLDQPSEDVCKGTLIEEKYRDLYNATDKNVIIEKISNAAKRELINKSFKVRLKQRNHLEYINNNYRHDDSLCYEVTRDMSRALRYLEDILIERLYSSDDSTKFSTLSGNKGDYFLVNPDFIFSDFDNLKSGDIILSRGNAFTSAAISRIGVTDAQFSHLSFVYRDTQGKLNTTEAHIELGNVIAPFRTHINQANGRTVVFRYKGNPRTAQYASHKVYHEVGKAQRKGRLIEYDFGMDYKDSSQLFCSEVASYGFKDQGISIPKVKTRFPRSLLPFLQKIGIKVNSQNIDTFETFGPGDLEFDPRFELVAEWRHPKKLRALRHKDAVLYKMFEWMENDDYQFRPTISTQAQSVIAFGARRGWLKRNFFGKDLTKEFPLNMKPSQMNFFVTLDKVGEKLEKRLSDYEKIHKKTLSFKESIALLERYRRKEKWKYETRGQEPDWYKYFHP